MNKSPTPQSDVDTLISQVKYDPAGKRTYNRVKKELIGAFKTGDASHWNKITALFSLPHYPDENIIRPMEVMLQAIKSNRQEVVSWCLRHSMWDDYESGKISKTALSALSKLLAEDLNSYGSKITPAFFSDILKDHPEILKGQRLNVSSCIRDLIDDAIKTNDSTFRFERLVQTFSNTDGSIHTKNSLLSDWLSCYFYGCTVNQARDLFRAVDKSPSAAKALEACFPLTISDFSVSAGGPMLGLTLPEVEVKSLSQLCGWSGGKASVVAFNEVIEKGPHSVKVAWQDPVLFKSWVYLASYEPATLAQLLARHEPLCQAMRTFRTEHGHNALHVILQTRLCQNYGNEGYQTLEKQLMKSCSELFVLDDPEGFLPVASKIMEDYFPTWHSAWRRNILGDIAKKNSSSKIKKQLPKL